MKKLLLFSLMLLILLSCSKGSDNQTGSKIKTINNNGAPSDPNFKYEVTEVLKADYFEKDIKSVSGITAISQTDIYLLDSRSCTVFHVDDDLNLINSFGGKGQGPGEFENTYSITAFNDTIAVVDDQLKRVTYFDRSGNFIRTSGFSGSIGWLKNIGNKFIGVEVSNETEDEKYYGIQAINTYDRDIRKISSMCERKKFIRNPRINVQRLPITAVGKERLYLYENSKKDITLTVLDWAGRTSQTIKDKAPVVEISREEIDAVTEKYKNYNLAPEVINEIIFADGKEKDTVMNIYIDKNNMLWLYKTYRKDQKEHPVYSIYKDGIYLRDISIPVTMEHKLYFENGKIYAVTDQDIIVFDYTEM